GHGAIGECTSFHLRRGPSNRSRREESRCERYGEGHQECAHSVSQAEDKRSSGSARNDQGLVAGCRPPKARKEVSGGYNTRGGVPRRISTMDLKDTAKQLRQILLLLQESGFTMPIIHTSIARHEGSLGL